MNPPPGCASAADLPRPYARVHKASTVAESLYALAATAVVMLHLAFIAFAVAGATAVWRWPRLVALHLPALAWATWISFSGDVCPLTPLENGLRRLAGRDGYASGFIEHYLLALIYPTGLTREVQALLGIGVLAINAVLYGAWLRSRWQRRNRPNG